MLASNNILNPKDGKPVVTPTQDMVIGVYYLTYIRVQRTGILRKTAEPSAGAAEAQMAYELKPYKPLHEKIRGDG